MIKYILTITLCAISVPLLCADNQAQSLRRRRITAPALPAPAIIIAPPAPRTAPTEHPMPRDNMSKRETAIVCCCVLSSIGLNLWGLYKFSPHPTYQPERYH